MTDTITVSLTREEAKCLAGDYIEAFTGDGKPIDFMAVERAAQAKLWAALDRESETPTQTPRKSPEPGPTTNGPEGPQVDNCHLADDSLAPGPPITEEQVKRATEAALDSYLTQLKESSGEGWDYNPSVEFRDVARACLEAARDA